MRQTYNIIDVKTRAELRKWFLRNHTKETECWVAVKRGKTPPKNMLWYIDAVEEALCFGWIDSTQKNINGIIYQRFSPRSKKGRWTELNKERSAFRTATATRVATAPSPARRCIGKDRIRRFERRTDGGVYLYRHAAEKRTKQKKNGYICTTMERIKLTKEEKQVFRLVASGAKCPDTYPKHVYTDSVRSLERKGLVKGFYAEGGKVVDACLTDEGKCYLSTNPSLKNPQDWKWVIGTAIAAAALVVSVLALCIACTLLK